MKLLWGACAVLACAWTAAYADPLHVQARTACGAGSYSDKQEVPLAVGLDGLPCPPGTFPLPTGAATAARQDTTNSSLTTIATNTGFQGTKTYVALRVSAVTTGGTAVTVLNAGDRTKGGFILNPEDATVNLCLNESGFTASGTISRGALICIAPSQAFTLTASPLAVSVISSDSAHPIVGEGYN